jgi:amino acid adenylation domain-containing protein
MEIIRERGRTCPDKVAIRQYGDDPRVLTYSELLHAVDGLAGRIRKRVGDDGVTPKIGLLVSRGVNQVISILGILAAGCAYVPLDPVNHPPDRIEYILQDSNAVGLVTESHSKLARSFGSKLRTIFVDKEVGGQAGEVVRYPPGLCYVIYTSGSTGRPKGVLVPEKGVINDIFCVFKKFMQSNEKLIQNVLLSTNICFDAHVDEVFLPLMFGGSITCLHGNLAQVHIDPNWNISLVQATPSVFNVIDLPDSVECVIVGGEQLTRSCLERIRSKNDTRLILNGYGPTETTNESSMHAVTDITDTRSIGQPIWNTQFYIFDKSGKHIAPLGAWGELYIGGVGVTEGYQNLPDLTKSVFLKKFHPSLPSDGVIYKTGDLVRVNLRTGCIEFGGRKEGGAQVKLRGYRIELGEIQHAILENNNAIKDCFVTIHKESIVAYVVGQGTSGLCYGHLAHYMRPNTIIALPELPRNISGKLDRKLLPLPEDTNDQTSCPTDPIVAAVVQCVVHALGGVPRNISAETNFFSIGGNSLNLVTLQNLLQAKFPDHPIKLQSLLQVQTIGKFAALVRGEDVAATVRDPCIVPLGEGSAGPPFFCIHAAGGQIHTYSHLASAVTSAFYGIQDPSLITGPGDRQESFEAMGRMYADRINKFYPEGPVFLGGHSSGGSIAFETARSLELEFARTVRAVFLIDTELVDEDDDGNVSAAEIISQSHHVLDRLKRLDEIGQYLYQGWREGLMSDYLASLGPGGGFWNLIRAIVPRRSENNKSNFSSDLVSMIGLLDHHLVIEKKYRPTPVRGEFDTILFRPAADSPYSVESAPTAPSTPRNEWNKMSLGKHTIVDVPNANHYNIVRPPAVGLIAAVIMDTMDRSVKLD